MRIYLCDTRRHLNKLIKFLGCKIKDEYYYTGMRMNPTKNDAKYHWTNHVQGKMMYYGLSADRVKRVMRSPHRSEKGIAPDTIAVMSPSGRSPAGRQRNGKPLPWKEEIWVMYAAAKPSKFKDDKFKNLNPRKKVIITAWRYPGKSPVREA